MNFNENLLPQTKEDHYLEFFYRIYFKVTNIQSNSNLYPNALYKYNTDPIFHKAYKLNMELMFDIFKERQND